VMKGTASLRVPMEGKDHSVWNFELRCGPIQQSGDLVGHHRPAFSLKLRVAKIVCTDTQTQNVVTRDQLNQREHFT